MISGSDTSSLVTKPVKPSAAEVVKNRMGYASGTRNLRNERAIGAL